MFKNIGSKLKGMAWDMFWILSSLGVCGAYLFWKIGSALSDRRILAIILAVMLVLFNIAISYTISLLIYGFGNIVEKHEKQNSTHADENTEVDADIKADNQ